MKYWFIKSNEKVFPIDKMCKVLEVSFSSYYRWKRSSVSNKVTKKEHLKVQKKRPAFDISDVEYGKRNLYFTSLIDLAKGMNKHSRDLFDFKFDFDNEF